MSDNKNAADGGEVVNQEEQVVEEKVGAEVEAEAEVSEKISEEAVKEGTAEAQVEEAQVEPEKTKPGKVNPFRQRISELTREKNEEKAAREALQEKLDKLQRPQQGEQTEEPTDGAKPDVVPASMVREMALQEARRIASEKQFNDDCNAAFDQGIKSYSDFKDAMDNFGALGGLEPDVIEDAIATGAAHQVLYDLGSNPDEAVRILKLPRGRRIAEFTRMTIKAAPAKPNVSKAAAPIRTVGGSAKKEFDPLDTSISDEEWHRREDERERNRRRA